MATYASNNLVDLRDRAYVVGEKYSGGILA